MCFAVKHAVTNALCQLWRASDMNMTDSIANSKSITPPGMKHSHLYSWSPDLQLD